MFSNSNPYRGPGWDIRRPILDTRLPENARYIPIYSEESRLLGTITLQGNRVNRGVERTYAELVGDEVPSTAARLAETAAPVTGEEMEDAPSTENSGGLQAILENETREDTSQGTNLENTAISSVPQGRVGKYWCMICENVVFLASRQTCCPVCCPPENCCKGKHTRAGDMVSKIPVKKVATKKLTVDGMRHCVIHGFVESEEGETCCRQCCGVKTCSREHWEAGWMFRGEEERIRAWLGTVD